MHPSEELPEQETVLFRLEDDVSRARSATSREP
ncbi:hypothetical protein E2C01_070446 [Portunus trituberculatus]|uniref:Uncharacterized protein n=1 Tax=Portunus trituberculatus TaxID=210409 RepID=A0A5B7I1L2_PORTR|nr:hypothetical protein [Portunus trituberculatus]